MLPLSGVYKCIRYLYRNPIDANTENNKISFWRHPKFSIFNDKPGYGYFITADNELFEGQIRISFSEVSMCSHINISIVSKDAIPTVINKNNEPIHAIFGETYPYILINELFTWKIYAYAPFCGDSQDDFLKMESYLDKQYSIIWDYVKQGLISEFIGVTVERGEVSKIDELARVQASDGIEKIIQIHQNNINQEWSPILIEIDSDVSSHQHIIFWYIKEKSWFNSVEFNLLDN